MAKIFVSHKHLKKIGLKYGDPVDITVSDGKIIISKGQANSKRHVSKRGLAIRIPARKVNVLSRVVFGNSVIVKYEVIRTEIIKGESELFKHICEEVMEKGKPANKFLIAHILEKHALHGYDFRVLEDEEVQYVAGKRPDGKWVLLRDDEIVATQSWWKQEVS